MVAARTERRRKAPRRKGRLHEAVPGWRGGGSPSRTACFLDITVGYFWWFRSGDNAVAAGGRGRDEDEGDGVARKWAWKAKQVGLPCGRHRGSVEEF